MLPFATIWPLIGPSYDALVSHGATFLVPVLADAPIRIDPGASHSTVGLLLALLLATPALGRTQRLRAVALGLSLLFVGHVAIRTFTLHGRLSLSPPRTVAELDRDRSGFIEDREVLHAHRLQRGGLISSALFIEALKAWIDETPIGVDGEADQRLRLDAVGHQPHPSWRAVTFVAQGRGIASMRVVVYDLDGRRIFDRTTEGHRLTWTGTTASGASVANGVYLYRVTVEGPNGATERSEIQPLKVLR